MCSVRRVGSGRKVPRNSFIKVIKETKKRKRETCCAPWFGNFGLKRIKPNPPSLVTSDLKKSKFGAA